MRTYLFLLSFVFIVACKKDSDAAGKSNTDLLSGAAWKFDNAKVDINNDGTGDVDVPDNVLATCIKDNLISFLKDKSGKISEGASKCTPTDPTERPFTWEFTNNEKTIKITNGSFFGLGDTIDIISLTDTELKAKLSITSAGVTTVVIVVLKH
jgi:Lipocalin-like domain